MPVWGRSSTEYHAARDDAQVSVLGYSYVESLEVARIKPVFGAWWLDELFCRLGWFVLLVFIYPWHAFSHSSSYSSFFSFSIVLKNKIAMVGGS